MTVSITINAPFGDADKPAALRAIAEHNGKLTEDEPLPTATNAEIKASYETVLAAHAMRVHEHQIELSAKEQYQTELREWWQGATPAQRAQLLNNLPS